MQTTNIFSTTISFNDFMMLLIQQPNKVLKNVRDIVIINPEQVFDAQVDLYSDQDERPRVTKPNSLLLDSITLGRTESGVNVGIQYEGTFPKLMFRNIVSALQGAREAIQWGRYNHARGSYAGVASNRVKNFLFCTDNNVVVQFNQNTSLDEMAQTKLEAVRWEMVTSPNGATFLNALGRDGKVYQTSIDPSKTRNQDPEQVVLNPSFDLVQTKQDDVIVDFVSIPNGTKSPMLILVGKNATYYNDQIVTKGQASAIGIDAKTGLVGLIADQHYYTAAVNGDKITPLEAVGDTLGETYKPLFGEVNPRILMNEDIALLVNVIPKGDDQVSISLPLPQRNVGRG